MSLHSQTLKFYGKIPTSTTAGERARIRRYFAKLARAQRLRPAPITAKIRFLWIEPSKRRDPAIVCAVGRKIILEALIEAGILPGGTWRYANRNLAWEDSFMIDRCGGVHVTMEWEV